MLKLTRKEKRVSFNLKGLSKDDLTILLACLDMADTKEIHTGYLPHAPITVVEQILSNLWDVLIKEKIA